MSTIADKLIAAAQNEQRIYKKGYDKGVADAGGTVITKPEVEGNYNITANGSYSYTPPADSVFSKVNVEVAVSGGTEDLNDVLTAQEEKLAELSAILDTKADGYDNGFEDGKKAEYDAFWDDFQQNGTRTDYQYAFRGSGWTPKSLRPKYTIAPTGEGAFAMFQRCFNSDRNQSELLDTSHLSFDLSNVTKASYMFQNAKVKNATLIFSDKITTLSQAFGKGDGGSQYGMYITLLVPNPNCNWDSAFAHHQVKELNLLEGTVIGTNGFDVHWATALPHDSIVSIINALSTTTSGLSTTLSKTAVNSAFATTTGGTDGSTSAEWTALIATRSNWTISLV